MNTPKKITKREYYAVLDALVNYAQEAGATLSDDMTYESLHDFVAHEVELLDNKAATAAKRAAEKKADGDALRERIYNVLGNEPMTIKEIVATLDDEEVSPQMVTARLTQLVKLDQVEKSEKSTGPDGKTKKLSAYRRVG